MPPTFSLDALPPTAALRSALGVATPPPEVTAADLLDDGETARVVYTPPSPDPTDPVNQAAIENLAAGYAALVGQYSSPPSRLRAIGLCDDDATPRLTWHVEAAWARRVRSEKWTPREFLERVADTSDMIVITD